MHDTRKIENLHVSLWLLKDVSWCSEWKLLGMVMIVPTLAVALKICWDTRRSPADLVHNIAVALWICANTVWMTGEFFYEDGTREYAKIFFYSGMVLLAGYYTHAWFRRNEDAPPTAF
jgi:uncharacterized membrane protein (GlpM family)